MTTYDPTRRDVIKTTAAAVALGALALDALWRWRPTSKDARAWTGPAVAVLATALAVALAHPGPGSMAVAARAPGIWHDRLRDLAAARPATDPQAAVVFLPFAPSPATEDFAATTERMLQNLDTGVPMVNGYSGFFPSDHATLRAQLRGFPDRRSLVALGERGARWVVVDAATWDPFDERVAATLGISEEARDQDAVLLILPPPGSLQ